MNFVLSFFLLVIFFSSSELFLLMKVATSFGFITAFSLCVLTGVVGGSIVRYQGLQTLRDIQISISEGRAPATEIVSGLILLFIGAFLLVPGFITDTMGMLLLFPPLRLLTSNLLIKYFMNRVKIHSNISGNVFTDLNRDEELSDTSDTIDIKADKSEFTD